MKDMDVEGDLIHDDNKDRRMWASLKDTTLKGKLKNVTLNMDAGSKWIATANSNVTLISNVNPAQFDAPKGVTIKAEAAESGEYTLSGGGKLLIKAKK